MTLEEFTEDVISVPHRDLGLRFDVDKMKEEIELISRFDQYQTLAERPRAYYAKHWSGASLVGTDGDAYSDFTELLPGNARIFEKTPIAEQCPYLYSVVEQVGGGKLRARVMRIGPEGSLYWHSHCLQHGQPKRMLTIHVPIIVPDAFEWSVVQVDDYMASHDQSPNMSKLSELDNKVYRQRYEPGAAVAFNSYHYHNVHNPNPSVFRVSLMIYIGLNNPVAHEIVEAAMEAYDGPRLLPPSQESLDRHRFGSSMMPLKR
jgi:hypothetical protein